MVIQSKVDNLEQRLSSINKALLNKQLVYASFNDDLVLFSCSEMFSSKYTTHSESYLHLFDLFPVEINGALESAIFERKTKAIIDCKILAPNNNVYSSKIGISFINNRIQIAIYDDPQL
ncbi:hypothetical protein [Flammeovirga sp. SJP92]|uniref:hypothetical protein n=1 Tax=Flammeovirga sp. SJP92 TaxID=1775430 RepID=UPI0007887FA3|nr:hypothetical protein [Flammeovirga sp. SJP92]KXX72414.1 hypothetical protein AVL50_02090 [Flammeovirga sp. SJP92]